MSTRHQEIEITGQCAWCLQRDMQAFALVCPRHVSDWRQQDTVRDEALNSMAELLAQAAAERDAARREVERLRQVLTLLLSHCSAHEQSAKLVGERAWWVATVPDPLEQARAALGESPK